ncbi:hypothetical protein L7F22_027988 [Adiantum nelumboides]|nr:hypothetical protein [Adiantum nelumboides]
MRPEDVVQAFNTADGVATFASTNLYVNFAISHPVAAAAPCTSLHKLEHGQPPSNRLVVRLTQWPHFRYHSQAAHDVGILQPDWLINNLTYLGQKSIDGFTFNVWSKIKYSVDCEDVHSSCPAAECFHMVCRPMSWHLKKGFSWKTVTSELLLIAPKSKVMENLK